MEVWILLAAAGSGYLARRWQNAQKAKGTSSDAVDPQDNSAWSSSQLPSARGRYRHFSSASKRQGGKSLGGKRTHQWGRLSAKNGQVAENTAIQNVIERKAEERVDFGGSEIQISSEVRAVKNAGDILSEIKSAASSVVDKSVAISENITAGCLVQSVQGNEIIAFEPSRIQEKSTALPIAGCDGSTFVGDKNEDGTWNVTNVIERVPRGQAADGRGLGGSDSFLPRSNSVKRLNDGRNENDLKGGCFLEDGYSGKRMKDALESTLPQEEPFVFGGTWMPGFWDVSEGVFVLDADSLLVQQKSEPRSRGSSTRKVKTPNKYGRSRGSMCRRKSLIAQKPMSSLESCLSAQLDENHKQRNAVEFLLRSGSSSRDESEQPEGDLGVSSDEGVLGHVVSEKMSTEGKVKVESAIGLPSLSRWPSRRSSLKKLKEIKSSTGRGSKRENLTNPFEGNKSVSHFKATQRNSAGWHNIGTRHEAKLQHPNGLNRESYTKDLQKEWLAAICSRQVKRGVPLTGSTSVALHQGLVTT